MRVSVVLVALAAVASASSLNKRQYPSCAVSCISSANLGGCSAADNACLCKSNDFVVSTATCIEKSCQGDDITKANQISRSVCAAAGVTLTQTLSGTATATSPSTGTPTATSTSSNNAATNLSGSPLFGVLAAVAGVVFAL